MEILTVTGGPVMTNAYLVADEDGACLVVDPGFDPDRLAEEVTARGWRVEAIVCTHGHFDHVAGGRRAKELWPVPLWMHPAAVPLATTCGEHARWFGIDCEDCPPPDLTFSHGDTFTVGTLSFVVRHTPGHSPGGVSLIGGGVALVGDVLFAGGIGRADLPHSDPQQLLASLREQLLTLPDETIVYPGHGEPTTIGAERRSNPYRQYFGGER